MSSISIAGDTSGSIILQAPAVSGSTTLTLPTTSGTVLTTANTFGAGTGPAFRAVSDSTATITINTTTKIPYNISQFDTNSNYSTVNYRFTPTVAGYYQISLGIGLQNNANNNGFLLLAYKNGASIASTMVTANNGMFGTTNLSTLIYMNGSTDYLEGYIRCAFGSYGLSTGNIATYDSAYFSGYLARGA
jgi:hypothetical protein